MSDDAFMSSRLRKVDCGVCGAGFGTRHPRKIYCSRRCALTAKRRQDDERRGTVRLAETHRDAPEHEGTPCTVAQAHSPGHKAGRLNTVVQAIPNDDQQLNPETRAVEKAAARVEMYRALEAGEVTEDDLQRSSPFHGRMHQSMVRWDDAEPLALSRSDNGPDRDTSEE